MSGAAPPAPSHTAPPASSPTAPPAPSPTAPPAPSPASAPSPVPSGGGGVPGAMGESSRRSHDDIKREFHSSLDLNPAIIEHRPEYEFRKVRCVPCNRVCALNGEFNLANFFIHTSSAVHKNKLVEEGLHWNDPPTPKPVRRRGRARRKRRRVETTPLYKLSVRLVQTYQDTQASLVIARRLIAQRRGPTTPSDMQSATPPPHDGVDGALLPSLSLAMEGDAKASKRPRKDEAGRADFVEWERVNEVDQHSLSAYMQKFPFKLHLQQHDPQHAWVYECRSCPSGCSFLIRVSHSANPAKKLFEACGRHNPEFHETLVAKMTAYRARFDQ